MTLNEITIGVISGIVSSVILGVLYFLIQTVWKMHVEPWWENKLYGDARVDGRWMSEIHTESTPPDKELITVRQTGHNVEGEIQCVSGPDKGRAYNFTGCIRNQILSGYYWNTDKHSIDSGSFSMRLEMDGSRLVGHTVYYHDDDHSLLSRVYDWNRIAVPTGPSNIDSPAEGQSAIESTGKIESVG
jgi:hypothetical protein